MVIGLHGDSTADVPRAVVEVHSIEQELAITQHPPVVANIVLDHLSKQTRAIPKGVLLMVIGLHGDSTADVLRPVGEVHSIEQELAITQHPPVVANIVLDHRTKQTRAIPKRVLSMVIGVPGACSERVQKLVEVE